MEHVPSALLRYADGAHDLVAGNSIPAVDQHPESHHPFVETDGRVFHDGSDLDAELFLAPPTLPAPLIRKPDHVSDLAARSADNLSIGPAERGQKVDAGLFVGVVANGFR